MILCRLSAHERNGNASTDPSKQEFGANSDVVMALLEGPTASPNRRMHHLRCEQSAVRETAECDAVGIRLPEGRPREELDSRAPVR